MASSRVVNTNFWKDSYVIDLDPIEKLLFLYLITNPRTSLAGAYEISFREVAFDTGIDKDMVQKIVARFCEDGKMYHENNWVVLTNFIKNQRLNPSIQKGVIKAIDQLPEWLKSKIVKVEDSTGIIGIVIQSDTSLGTVTPQRKEKKRNIKKRNININKALEAPVDTDLVSSLYFKTIKHFGLPTRNVNNVRSTIEKLKRELPENEAISYLSFLINRYGDIQLDLKPELSEALDIYSKRGQIMNAVKRTATKQKQDAARTVVADE